MPVILICEICKTEVKLKPSALKKRRTCSRDCHAKLKSKERSGKNHPGWKGGKEIHNEGYVRIHCPNHPKSHRGKVFEHRLVMEKHLGRYLRKDELVHHKGIKYPRGSIKNKQDNRIENLELSRRSKHINDHRKDLENGKKKDIL